MNSQEIKSFVRQQGRLFWYIPEDQKEDISEELLVETILNFGDLDALRDLISLLGINKTAEVFFRSINRSERSLGNYNELTINFFTLFFKRNAP